jgi:hypothetical protein
MSQAIPLPARVALGVVLVVTASCVQTDHMNQGGEEMSAALSDARAENERHASTCNAVSSMPDMMSEVAMHDDRMAGLAKRMDDAQNHMGEGSMMSMHCSGPSFDHLASSVTDMHSEMAVHSERMHAATSLGAAQAECATHTDTMREMMGGMMDDLDSIPCMDR